MSKYQVSERQEEINSLIEKLRILWSRKPYLRLGQVIVGATLPADATPELFYLPDSKFETMLDDRLGQG